MGRAIIKPYPSHCNSWLNCSAYCVATQYAERTPPNINQLEGLANHKIIEHSLIRGTDINSYLGSVQTVKGESITVSVEMLTRVRGYINYINSIRGTAETWGVEEPVTISPIHDNYRGKVDYWQYGNNQLTVVDYKDGWGYVSPVQNYTLSSYIIGLTTKKNLKIDRFNAVIYQPRISLKPVVYTVTLDVINLHSERLKRAYIRAVNGPHMETPGDHCKWCTARPNCQGFNSVVNSLYVAYSHTPGVKDYDHGKRLEFLENAAMMINASLTAEREVVITKLNRGETVPGWALSQGRGKLKFRENVNPEKIKTMCEMYGVEAGKYSLKTPTQIKAAGLPEEVLVDYTERSTGNSTLKKINHNYILEIFKNE
jgi:hypothetical protein